ncbi:tyrosine-type recombinase/integrase [Halolamina salina]|uniref:Tyrosine-type recombinase/integrase n=2 Tax=Halolamina salina TaxID=1220023 RepID=A0ABD6B9N7_9EURY
MMTEEYDDKDGRRVWLSRSEVEQLLGVADDPLRKVAFRLGAEVGLRSHEVVEVRPEHVVDGGEAGQMLVVPEGKGEKYREAPIPDSLADTVDAAASFGGVDDDEVLVDRSTRSVRNWVEGAREELASATGEDRWEHLTFHDLRRTWAGQLANADVDETVALRWGGWNDLDTFLNHYRGEATEKAQARERGKVEWL